MFDAPIVVGVDGSAASFDALTWAVTEAAATGRAVRALAVWSYAPALEPGVAGKPVDDIVAGYRRHLDDMIRKASASHPTVSVDAELVEGDAVPELLAAAREASLLVLGSHRRGPLMAALRRSVSTRCAHRATCPVVIIPPHGPAVDFATDGYVPGPLL